jgi:hypothetical protein
MVSVNAVGLVPDRLAKADGIVLTNIAKGMHATKTISIWRYHLRLELDSLIPADDADMVRWVYQYDSAADCGRNIISLVVA